MSKFEIKELLVSDWRAYKAIRLKSLRNSPEAFSSTYERAVSFSIDQWKSGLNAFPNSRDKLALIAKNKETSVGLVFGVRDSSEIECAHIYQMWVEPEFRGLGIGAALINGVKEWASVMGIEKLMLGVTTNNLKAVSLYSSIGFIPVGAKEPLRIGSELDVQHMELKLNVADV